MRQKGCEALTHGDLSVFLPLQATSASVALRNALMLRKKGISNCEEAELREEMSRGSLEVPLVIIHFRWGFSTVNHPAIGGPP